MLGKTQRWSGRRGRSHLALAAAAGAILLAGAGCGPAVELGQAGVTTDELAADNGLSPNGLSQNGLSQNGLSQNGLSQNGLSQNGLSQNGLGSGFSIWFNQNPAVSSAVMRYLVHCAVASGQVRTWTNPVSGTAYSWTGELGLAPNWATGSSATVAEQQVITACLAAHVNKYGVQVPISVLGKSAKGVEVPYTSKELASYNVSEACFFGNLFQDRAAVFVGLDHPALDQNHSTARACGIDNLMVASECPPMLVVGDCLKLCTKAKASDPYYATCTYQGVAYKPITTRMDQAYIYKCGDGVCQVSESCGTGNTYDNCGLDCGPCR